MKIALFGGTFNPIHIGHLAVADDVCISLGYDKVLFVPARTPPHKTLSEDPGAAVRAELCALALASDARFELECCELEREGASYTFDTVRLLERKYKPEDPLGLIIGGDLIDTFRLWYKAEALSRMCRLIVARRPSEASGTRVAPGMRGECGPFQGCGQGAGEGAGDLSAFENKPCGEYANESLRDESANAKLFRDAVFLENPMLPISSTEIRYRAANKLAFRYLVPEKVFEYIMSRNLYGRPRD